MDTYDCILNRRSIRRYKDIPIEEEILQQIINAGLFAPSGLNLQPWYFLVINSQESKKVLLDIMAGVAMGFRKTLEKRFPDHPEVVNATVGFLENLGGAVSCILVFKNKDYPGSSPDGLAIGIGAAVQNIMLAATNEGIGSCCLTSPASVGAGESFKKAFNLEDKGDFMALITLGYPDDTPLAPKRKVGRFDFI